MEDNKRIILEVSVNDTLKSIPFTSFETLDEFTSCFQDKKELTNLFFPNTEKKPDFIRIKYTYKERNSDRLKTLYLKIKYAKDNFDEEDLKKQFINFLSLHPEQITDPYWEVFYVINNIRNKNNKKGYITKEEIEYAVNHIFSKGYKTKRDIYFKLKELNIDILVNEKKLYFEKNRFNPSNRLQEYEMKDEFLEYLQNISLRGEDEYNYAMEEMSLYDLEKLPKKNITGNNKPLFDGTDIISIEPDDNVIELVMQIKKLSPENKQKLISLLQCFKEKNQIDGKKRCKK